MRRIALSFMLLASLVSSVFAAQIVPPGNRNSTQPKIPGASVQRTSEGKTTFDLKYEKVRDLLASDKELISKIKAVSAKFDIDPVHMMGAIVGEHTYNVDAYDRLQTYYIKAASYAGESFRFGYDGEKIEDFVARPEFSKCNDESGSYDVWTCRETVWENTFRGKKVAGTSFPNNRFSAVFFQPFYAGQTFGIGQINPLTALELTDTVNKYAGLPKLDEKKAADVYGAIMDPDQSLAYMAASIRISIDLYKSIARVDISKNPGITATLYNIGNPKEHARELAARGGLPEENYYGWLVNDKLKELQSLL